MSKSGRESSVAGLVRRKLSRQMRPPGWTPWMFSAARVEVYSQPAGRRYLKREDYEETAQVPVVLDGVDQGTIAVDDILPTRKAGGA